MIKRLSNINIWILFGLTLMWCIFEESLAMTTILLGIFFALVTSWITQPLRIYRVRIKKPVLALKLLVYFIKEIIVANIQVAKLAWKPNLNLKPAFLHLPLEVDNDFSIMILAFMITLTPGTLSVDVTPDRKFLVIHFLNVENPQTEGQRIKTLFEYPLMEVLKCSKLSS